MEIVWVTVGAEERGLVLQYESLSENWLFASSAPLPVMVPASDGGPWGRRLAVGRWRNADAWGSRPVLCPA